MKRSVMFLLSAGLVLAAAAQAQQQVIRIDLQGTQEVPAVSTAAAGQFQARISDGSVRYQLTYSGLEGNVTQAHIHVGQHGVNGGIAVWLCSNLASPPTPAGVQACPAAGTITGVITPGDVVGPSGQGLAPGEFQEFVRALRAGVGYANVHTTKFPGGELRGQLRHPPG